MAETFFLHKSKIDSANLIQLGSEPALEQHAALSQFLQERIGRAAADLFAEPILSRGNGASETTVSWYVTRSEDGKPLVDLPSDQRSQVEKQLSQTLASVSEALSDPDFGPLVGAALHIYDENSVWAVGGKPVLLNWGMMPAASSATVASRDHHFSETLGRFLPIAAAPAINAAEWQARGYSARPQVDAGVAAPEMTPVAGESGQTGDSGEIGDSDALKVSGVVAEDRSVWRWRWIAPIGLFILFLAILIWVLLPGSLLYPPRPAASIIEEGDIADAARDGNRALERRISELRTAIDGAVCTPSGELRLPSGLTPDGRAIPAYPPSGDEQSEDPAQAGQPVPIEPDPLLPPAPSNLVRPSSDGEDPARLLDLLEERTALVLAQGESGGGHGTGFFISPDLLVTNYHVIESALDGGRIGVTNERLNQVTLAELVAYDGPLEVTGADFAVLRLPGANMPFYTIAEQEGSLRLQQVIAAGYPSFVLETDSQFRRLMEGDAAATPGLVVTDGIVNAEQDLSPATRVLIHTAHTSPGNSGGPLVDGCGRLVGINTFIRSDNTSLNSLNFSLKGGDLLRFLSTKNLRANVTSEACTPTIARPEPQRAESNLDGADTPAPEPEAQ